MTLSAADNDRLTRVEGDAPLGRLLRESYWLPFSRSEGLAPGGPPRRVRLLGRNLVAFRAKDGRVGLMDERCPHRLASLALARVEDCSLRCIYHGWRLDGTGAVVEVPSEGERSAEFAARVRVNRYQTHEAGGLVWAYMGGGEAPALPPLPFVDAPPERRWWSRMLVRCNWLQGFEGALDSVHLNWLHRGWNETPGQEALQAASPAYQIEETAYGLRTAAIRELDDDQQHFRVAEFIAPFYALSASRQPVIPSDCSVFISVPMDDTSHMLFFGFWDEAGPLQDVSSFFPGDLDRDDMFSDADTSGEAWGQDRAAIDSGHFSGFTRSVLHEDLGVQLSMGPIVDRSEEQLCGTDLAIVRTRRSLLKLLRSFEAGESVDGSLRAYAAERALPFSCVAPAGSDWRDQGMLRAAAG